jgi:2-oxoglutarate ferredoxin oxidoreductase subunit alpha
VDKPWAISGCQGRKPNIINTLHLGSEELENRNLHLANKYKLIQAQEKRAESYLVEDAELVVVAFGIMARIVKKAVVEARKRGIKAGLVRPITLWPFPDEDLRQAAEHARLFLSVEISMGQMIQDIQLALAGRVPVEFYGRIGFTPNPEEILQEIIRLAAREGL